MGTVKLIAATISCRHRLRWLWERRAEAIDTLRWSRRITGTTVAVTLKWVSGKTSALEAAESAAEGDIVLLFRSQMQHADKTWKECWIAARSFVGPGVEVGDAAVASVEREIIVAGSPAKFVGKRGRDTLADRSSWRFSQARPI